MTEKLSNVDDKGDEFRRHLELSVGSTQRRCLVSVAGRGGGLSSKSQLDPTQNTHNPWVWLASSQAFGVFLKNTEYNSAKEKGKLTK